MTRDPAFLCRGVPHVRTPGLSVVVAFPTSATLSRERTIAVMNEVARRWMSPNLFIAGSSYNMDQLRECINDTEVSRPEFVTYLGQSSVPEEFRHESIQAFVCAVESLESAIPTEAGQLFTIYAKQNKIPCYWA